MKKFQVQIAQSAKRDLKDIVSYICFQLQEQSTAKKLHQKIKEQILELDHMPERYPLWEDEPWHSRGLRKLLVKNYYVFYLVDHAQDCVRVVRVMYAGRDVTTQLQEMDQDDFR